MSRELHVRQSDLPLAVVLEKRGRRVVYILKSAGKKKFGLQLVKPERTRNDRIRS